VKVADLLFGEVGLVERGSDFVLAKVATILPLGDQVA
jgi:hypothetical protein